MNSLCVGNPIESTLHNPRHPEDQYSIISKWFVNKLPCFQSTFFILTFIHFIYFHFHFHLDWDFDLDM